MIRYAYHALGAHPAPFTHVALRNPHETAEAPDLPAQVDSGADRTVVPQQLIQALGLVQLDQIAVRALDGYTLTLPTYLVQLTVRQQTPFMIEVVGSQGEPWVLLGRDVLNRYRILLDGPGLGLEIA